MKQSKEKLLIKMTEEILEDFCRQHSCEDFSYNQIKQQESTEQKNARSYLAGALERDMLNKSPYEDIPKSVVDKSILKEDILHAITSNKDFYYRSFLRNQSTTEEAADKEKLSDPDLIDKIISDSKEELADRILSDDDFFDDKPISREELFDMIVMSREISNKDFPSEPTLAVVRLRKIKARTEYILPMAKMLGELFMHTGHHVGSFSRGDQVVKEGVSAPLLFTLWAMEILTGIDLPGAPGVKDVKNTDFKNRDKIKSAVTSLDKALRKDDDHLKSMGRAPIGHRNSGLLERKAEHQASKQWTLKMWGRGGSAKIPDHLYLYAVQMLYIALTKSLHEYKSNTGTYYKSAFFMPVKSKEYPFDIERTYNNKTGKYKVEYDKRDRKTVWELLKVPDKDLDDNNIVTIKVEQIICHIMYFLSIKNSEDNIFWFKNVKDAVDAKVKTNIQHLTSEKELAKPLRDILIKLEEITKATLPKEMFPNSTMPFG